MIGGIGLAIDFDAADPAAQILCREDEVATIRAISPLRMIVQSAGRRPRLVRDCSCSMRRDSSVRAAPIDESARAADPMTSKLKSPHNRLDAATV